MALVEPTIQCSYPNCKDTANVKVSYKPIGTRLEPVRALCNTHYEVTDEDGNKYYQIGASKIEVLVN